MKKIQMPYDKLGLTRGNGRNKCVKKIVKRISKVTRREGVGDTPFFLQVS